MSNNTNKCISLEQLKELREKSKLPTNDLVFHCLFGSRGNEMITKDFIKQTLKKDVKKIDLDLNLNLEKEHYDDKLGVLDVRAKDETGVNFNIEMQNVTSKTLPERILSYWSRLYNGDLKIGKDYTILNKTIAILILNDDMNNLEIIKKFHTKWNIREETYKDVILTDYLEIHILELKKYKKMRTEKNKNIWLDFILEPQSREVVKAVENSKELKEAQTKWRKITEDERLRDRALRLEIAMLDQNTWRKDAEKQGYEEGMEKRNGKWNEKTE